MKISDNYMSLGHTKGVRLTAKSKCEMKPASQAAESEFDTFLSKATGRAEEAKPRKCPSGEAGDLGTSEHEQDPKRPRKSEHRTIQQDGSTPLPQVTLLAMQTLGWQASMMDCRGSVDKSVDPLGQLSELGTQVATISAAEIELLATPLLAAVQSEALDGEDPELISTPRTELAPTQVPMEVDSSVPISSLSEAFPHLAVQDDAVSGKLTSVVVKHPQDVANPSGVKLTEDTTAGSKPLIAPANSDLTSTPMAVQTGSAERSMFVAQSQNLPPKGRPAQDGDLRSSLRVPIRVGSINSIQPQEEVKTDLLPRGGTQGSLANSQMGHQLVSDKLTIETGGLKPASKGISEDEKPLMTEVSAAFPGDQISVTGDHGQRNLSSGQIPHSTDHPFSSTLPKQIETLLMQAKNLTISGGGITEMQMTLEPEELGKLGMRISMENGLVTARLDAESHMVKQLIEAELPRLRDTLERQGIQLDQVSVQVGSGQAQGFGDRQTRDQRPLWSQRHRRDQVAGSTALAGSHSQIITTSRPKLGHSFDYTV